MAIGQGSEAPAVRAQLKVLTLCHLEARRCCLAVSRRRLCICPLAPGLGRLFGLGTDRTQSSGRMQVWTPAPAEKHTFSLKIRTRLSPEPGH